MKHKIVCLLTALVSAALILAACGGKTEGKTSTANASADAEFIIGNGAEPQSLDPAKIQGMPEHRINLALFEGLVTYDPKTANAIPGVAKSWDISEDGTTYTFHLRRDSAL